MKAILCPGPMRDVVVRRLLQHLHQECVALCRKKLVSSVLRGLQPHELVSFSFSQLIEEWASTAPLFLQFLTTAANVNPSHPGSNLASICTAGTVLLRQRNMHMSALQHIAGLILFHGNASKLAHVRLNHLQLAVTRCNSWQGGPICSWI